MKRSKASSGGKEALQVQKDIALSQRQTLSAWEQARLMWVNSTCSAGRGEGQAGCNWSSDKLFDVGLYLRALPPFAAQFDRPHLHFTSGYCKLVSAFDSFFFFFFFGSLHTPTNQSKYAYGKKSSFHPVLHYGEERE